MKLKQIQDNKQYLYYFGFLSIVVFLSSLSYISQIGLYSDDWAFLSVLHGASDKSFFNLIELYNSIAPDPSYRPIKSIYQASLYYFFDIQPIYFHMVNHFVLLINVVFVFVILKKLKLDPTIALGIALLFALLPNYSTTKFWYAANQANLCILFYLLSLYIDIRSLNSSYVKFWIWKSFSLLFIGCSVLAYEIVFPLYLLNLLIIFIMPRYYPNTENSTKVKENSLKIIVLNIVMLMFLFLYKLGSTDLSTHIDYFYNVKRVFSGIFYIHFIGYGILIPDKLYKIFLHSNNPYLFIISLITSLFIFYYIYSNLDKTSFSELRRSYFLKLIALGIFILFLGYGVAIYSTNVSFTLAGVNNRTAVGATIGIAIIMVGLSGLICRLASNKKTISIIFSLFITIISFYGITTTNYISNFWIESYKQQNKVIEKLNLIKNTFNKDSTILIDGICPYIGPGIVFEANWDVEGVYSIYFKEYSLKGDIVRFNTQVRKKSIFTSVYGVDNNYYYGDNLYVFNYRLNKLINLQNYQKAQIYFSENIDNIHDCPTGYEGSGVKIF